MAEVQSTSRASSFSKNSALNSSFQTALRQPEPQTATTASQAAETPKTKKGDPIATLLKRAGSAIKKLIFNKQYKQSEPLPIAKNSFVEKSTDTKTKATEEDINPANINPETAKAYLSLKNKMAAEARFFNNPFNNDNARDNSKRIYAAELNNLTAEMPLSQIPNFTAKIGERDKTVVKTSWLQYASEGPPVILQIFNDPPDPLEDLLNEADKFRERINEQPPQSVEAAREEIKPLRERIVHCLKNQTNYTNGSMTPVMQKRIYDAYLYMQAYVHSNEFLSQVGHSMVSEAQDDGFIQPAIKAFYFFKVENPPNIKNKNGLVEL